MADEILYPVAPATPIDTVRYWTLSWDAFQARLTETEWEELELYIQPNAADDATAARRRAKVRRFFARRPRKIVLTDSEVVRVVTILRQDNVLDAPRGARLTAILETPPAPAEQVFS